MRDRPATAAYNAPRRAGLPCTGCGSRCWAAVIITVLSAAHAEGRIVHVDRSATGENSGMDWKNAFVLLQDAIAASGPGDELRIAEGTYLPDRGQGRTPGDRNATFTFKDNMSVYGGFPSGGAPMEDRNPTRHLTVLSGDLAGNDGNDLPQGNPQAPPQNDGSLHVVTISNLVVGVFLDGLVIRGGRAEGTYPDNVGAGLLILDAPCTVVNCTFVDNRADMGGGIYDMRMGDISVRTVLRYCTFTDNLAWTGGGAIYVVLDGPDIEDSCFTGNTAGQNGAGGAIACNIGGPTIQRCRFFGNRAHWGGAIDNDAGSTSIVSCAFSGNTASFGGAVSNTNAGQLVLINCTLSRNSAEVYGGGVRTYERSASSLVNCILWDNDALDGGDQLSLRHGTRGSVRFCNMQAGSDSVLVEEDSQLDLSSGNNIADDARFIDADGPDGTPGTGDDDLHLLASSPCIDAGDANALPRAARDVDGRPRHTDAPQRPDTGSGAPPAIDIGADEFTLKADISLEGVVDTHDLLILAGQWLQMQIPDHGTRPDADLTGDHTVNMLDFAVFATYWLAGT